MPIIKRVGVLSVAKFQTVFMAIIGLVEGIIFSLIPMYTGLFGSGLVLIVLFPILFGVIGFIVGAIGAWLYNLIARHIGGIKVEFDR